LQIGRSIDHVISLEVVNAEIIKRLSGRRSCPVCGKCYHQIFDPPVQDNLCNYCSLELVQRDDDREQTVSNRLLVYEAQTAPLKDYYQVKGLLRPIDGMGSIAEVQQLIVDLLVH